MFTYMQVVRLCCGYVQVLGGQERARVRGDSEPTPPYPCVSAALEEQQVLSVVHSYNPGFGEMEPGGLLGLFD